MKNFIIRIFSFACALMATSYLLDSVNISNFETAIFAAIIFAICDSLLRPILLIISLPITVITLGLFALVVNGGIFYLVSGMTDGFDVTSFGGAILGSIVVSIINMVITNTLEKN